MLSHDDDGDGGDGKCSLNVNRLEDDDGGSGSGHDIKHYALWSQVYNITSFKYAKWPVNCNLIKL